ncbi:MAG: HDOD domain-containing protein [Methylococcaceae bacterium]|nr:HDOD domain-containing protein [Methylococcaceae bacterium]
MPSTQLMQLEISKLKHLPPLPEESCRILTALNDPDIELEKLAHVLSTSPILVGRLLGLANSAYFGYPGTVISLKVAIINVLGLKLVKSFSLSILLSTTLDSHRCKHFDSERFWRNTLLTAVSAQKLALLKQGAFDSSLVYTAGILLHIGILAAVHVYPKQMDQLLLEKNNESMLDALMTRCHVIDQYQIGSYLLERWQLPVIFQNIVKHYADANFQGEVLPLINLLRLANVLLTMMLQNEEKIPDEGLALMQALEVKEPEILSIKVAISEKMDDLNALVKTMAGK